MKNKKTLVTLMVSTFLTLVFCILLNPIEVKAGSTIYVDASTTGSETGSTNNPFRTLKKALKEADRDDTVAVRAGIYEGNVTIPKNVTVTGVHRDEVFIVAKSKHYPVIKMRDGSELNDLTVMSGSYGIYVKRGSQVTVEGCTIGYNESHGIKVKKSDLSDESTVTINGNIILRNGGAGIYVQKRMVIIYNNHIYSNGKDGVYLQGEVAADVEYNKIKYNEKSGVDLIIDSSTILIANNTFKNNEQSGVDVHAKSWRGKVLIKNSKFYHNDEYGIKKIQYGSPIWDIWDQDYILGDGNLFVDNKKGKISSVEIKG
ncbi:MAG: right-handed parallel beta-helix repeat-containing protein [Patescibacteria group bacterium]|nr:right-handed parallel beta-helix repeat-containing protein [Patescibacteria group bacterium]